MRSSPYVIDYEATFRFEVTPDELWETLEQPDRFERWWTWLGEFRFEPAAPEPAGPRGPDNGVLAPGAVLHGIVAPPLPYRMRLNVVLDDCAPPSRIDASVHGDLEGHAVLHLEPAGDGTVATVAWTIEMMQPPMRLAARVAHPLLRWGHDRVVDATVAGFRRQLRPGARG